MMRIRHMGVRVMHVFMPMRVTVRAGGHDVMRVQVVPICGLGGVAVGVFMLQNRMRMRVTMRLHQMQGYASQHQHARSQHDPAHRAITKCKCTHRANKRCKSKYGTRARRAKSTLRQEVKAQTQAITHRAHGDEG